MPRSLATTGTLLLAMAALTAFPALAGKFYLQLFSTIMIMAIFAMSLNLLVGCTGLVSLGHAAFFGLGAYTLLVMSPEYQAASLFLSLPAAMAVAAVAALGIGLLVLRSSGVYFIMVTLAFTQMFFYFVTGSKALGGSDGAYIYVKPDASLFGLTPLRLADTLHFYYLVLALMLATLLLLYIVMRAPFGQVLYGIKANEPRMRSLGYASFRYKLVSFVIAGALAGMAGYLDAAQFGFVNPDLFGWRQSGIVLMMVILGGMGTLYGPILGAFALVLLQDFLAESTKHWLLPMGLFIILAVLVLPDGLSGIGPQLGALRRRLSRRGSEVA
jgi:branched-chain amino acid transport system permease protein